MATGSEAPDIQIPPAPPPADATAVELAVLEQPCTPVTSLATSSACEPWREFIQTQLHLRRNATAIYQDLVDLHGFTLRYNSVKRFVAKLQQREPEQFDRLEFAPGEEAQVDYGERALTFDPLTQRWRKPRLFVMTLRYSRRSFRRVAWKSSQQVWAQLHEQAFRYFGGVPRYVVLDNLKEGVIKPDLYEPELNSVQNTKIEMPVGARRWHQGGNAVDQLQWREGELVCPGAAPITGRLAVPIGQHLFGLKALQQAPAHEGAQDAAAQGGLHLGHGGLIDAAGRMKNHLAG